MAHRVVFLLILSVWQILECQSFEFKNLFGIYSTNTASSNIETSSLPSNLFESDEKLENASFSFMEDLDRDDYNASISSLKDFLDTVAAQQQNMSNDSLMNPNLTEVVMNGSEHHVNTPPSAEVSSSITQKSMEVTTAISQVVNRTDSSFNNATTEEPEEVVLKEPSTFSYVTKTIYQKTVDFMGDPYTMSIFVPVAAGVLFALTIIITIATCRCMKRKCRRRRFRKRVLPDSIKSLRPSDQARLLGDCCDSSDEF